MRMAFGLVSLLVVVGIIAFLMKGQVEVVREGNKAREQAAQIAGRDANGMRASDSITLEPQFRNSHLDYLLVTDIVADGPMAQHFGLQRNDSIVEVGPQKVRDIGDAELAKAQTWESYQRSWTLVVVRDGQRLTLPQAAPARGSGSKGSNDPLQKQLDVIQQIPGQ